MSGLESPFVVPVAFFAAWLGVVIVKSISGYKVRELRSQERLAAIEKGLPVPPEEPTEDERELGAAQGASRGPNPARRIANLRTGGIVCISIGIGLVLFFAMLTHVIQERLLLCGAAVGLIPLAIGVGLLIDMGIQRKELAAVPPAPQPPPQY